MASDYILTSIRELNWMTGDYGAFDSQLIPKINAALMILNQLGIGEYGFQVIDGTEKWEDFLGDTEANLGLTGVREYVGQKVRSMFDPPQGAAAEANKAITAELEWRLNTAVDPNTTYNSSS